MNAAAAVIFAPVLTTITFIGTIAVPQRSAPSLPTRVEILFDFCIYVSDSQQAVQRGSFGEEMKLLSDTGVPGTAPQSHVSVGPQVSDIVGRKFDEGVSSASSRRLKRPTKSSRYYHRSFREVWPVEAISSSSVSAAVPGPRVSSQWHPKCEPASICRKVLLPCEKPYWAEGITYWTIESELT